MIRVFNYLLENKIDSEKCNDWLCLKVENLVRLRNEMLQQGLVYELEEEFLKVGIDNSLLVYAEERALPSYEFQYINSLNELSDIFLITSYKIVCFERYMNSAGIDDEMLFNAEILILDAIEKNPFISYKDLIYLSSDLDMETQLEHMINSEEIIRYKKRNRYRWKINDQIN